MLLTSVLIAVLTLTVVEPGASAATTTDKQVATIRAEVTRINKGLAKLKKTTMMVDNVSLEGTEATYYRSGKTIRKISAQLLGETYQAKIDLYYSADQLIFAFDRHSTYKAGLGSPIDRTVEFRVYYVKGKNIRTTADSKLLTDDEASTEVDALNEISVELKAAIA
jgi:hypothetical protein